MFLEVYTGCKSQATDPVGSPSASRVDTRQRPSLEERYGNYQGYVDVVKAAAKRVVAERFLLRVNADRLIAEASASSVLTDPSGDR